MSLDFLSAPGNDFLLAERRVADKIIRCADGDSALLYLYILQQGSAFEETAAKNALHFSDERFARAAFTLSSLEIVKTMPDAAAPTLPEYAPETLREARGSDHKFSAVCQTAESVFGRTLSESLLRALFLAYDYLGLPADVIILLLTDLKEKKKRFTKKALTDAAFLWADMGIDSLSKAMDYLNKQEALRPAAAGMLEALGLPDRPVTAAEERYLADFLQKGFPPEALALAKQRMEDAIGKFSWKYLNGILNKWHQAGVHTVSEINGLEPAKTARKTAAEKNYIHQPTPEGQLADWEMQWLRELKHQTP